MKLDIPAGRYVVAVSGGVDSMVLLDMLATDPRRAAGKWHLVVAHFDHGIREDSALDRKLVSRAAKHYGLQFVYDTGHLGPGASEAVARTARYAFLESVRTAALADAIITAHHQDDVIETALINLSRGTNRRGLTSLRSRKLLLRPLLGVSKQEILAYAHRHGIAWHEDSTNADPSYLRNHIRLNLMPRLGEGGRQEILNLLSNVANVNEDLDEQLQNMLTIVSKDGALLRALFKQLPDVIAYEIVAAWLRDHNMRGYESGTLERVSTGIKTLTTGKQIDVLEGWYVLLTRDRAVLHNRTQSTKK